MEKFYPHRHVGFGGLKASNHFHTHADDARKSLNHFSSSFSPL